MGWGVFIPGGSGVAGGGWLPGPRVLAFVLGGVDWTRLAGGGIIFRDWHPGRELAYMGAKSINRCLPPFQAREFA